MARARATPGAVPKPATKLPMSPGRLGARGPQTEAGGAVARRLVAVAAAVVLAVEACGVVLLNWVLGLAVDTQQMSLAGVEPRTMAVSVWAVGLLLGGYLLLCGALLLRTALLDQAPTGVRQALLVSCAVGHGLLGALVVGPVGWVAFAAVMLSLALQVLALVLAGDATPSGVADPPEEDADTDTDGADGSGTVTPTAG